MPDICSDLTAPEVRPETNRSATSAMSDWAVVVPVKEWSAAKSRVTGLDERARRELAIALATDTVRTICRTPGVASCIVVSPDENLRELRPRLDSSLVRGVQEQPQAGLDPLNAALFLGRDAALSAGHQQVAMLVADLPGLSTSGLQSFLRLVPPTGVALICDQAGTGTTLLAGRHGDRLRPAFGSGSAQRHMSNGAIDITAWCDPALRLDTDTWADLSVAADLAGPALRRWLNGCQRTA